MIATFLLGELTSARFGPAIRAALAGAGFSERLLTEANLANATENLARREVLAVTRGYGKQRELFDADFPARVRWVRAVLTPGELARVRYMDYSYWNELSGGSRLPAMLSTASARAHACSGCRTAGSSRRRELWRGVNGSRR